VLYFEYEFSIGLFKAYISSVSTFHEFLITGDFNTHVDDLTDSNADLASKINSNCEFFLFVDDAKLFRYIGKQSISMIVGHFPQDIPPLVNPRIFPSDIFPLG